MAKENRPKIRIEMEQADWILEALSVCGLLLLFLLPAAYYRDLPAIIPQHFNASGEADGYGAKSTLWFLPAIGLVLFLALTAINRAPHIFNYPVKITPENAEHQYRLATRLIRMLKVAVLLLFTYLCWEMMQGALRGKAELNPVLMWAVLGGFVPVIGWYWVAAFRKK